MDTIPCRSADIPDKTPKSVTLSVILAVYNGEKTISQAIASIQCQTFTDWELIIVDDGSSDRTPLLLAEIAFQDPRLRVLSNKTNLGLAFSLNRAIAKSHGQYIARMDADDISLPQRFEAQVALLNSHPSIDVVGSAVELIDTTGEPCGIHSRPEHHEELIRSMFYETPLLHPTVMARREFFVHSGGYDQTLRYSQDADLWYRTYDRFRYYNLQTPLVRYKLRAAPSLHRVMWSGFVTLRAGLRKGCVGKAAYAVTRKLSAALLGKIGYQRGNLRSTTP